MNLKYYLRGLGIGIVVSTIIVGIAANNRTNTPSDEEIRQRAKELGMVEATGILADEVPSAETLQEAEQEGTENLPTEEPETTSSPVAEKETVEEVSAEEPVAMVSPAVEDKVPEAAPTEEPEAAASPTAEVAEPEASPSTKAEETSSAGDDRAEATEATPTPAKTAASGETVSITVKSGEGSYSVCKKLEAAGLVESAASYDTYLYERGYDKRIIAATYEIPAGADEEQIAKIITGKN